MRNIGCKLFGLLLVFVTININMYSVNAQQVIIDDDFSDGDFTNNPAWLDPENKHIVNAQNQLQLDAPAVADTAVISTSSTAAFGEWEFWVNFDFNPSSTSFSRLYLVADNNTLKGPVNGYFVRVGHTDDEVSLFRQDGNSETKIIDGTDDLIDNSSVTVRIRVTRDLDGNWELLADATGGQNFASEGTASDLTYTASNHIGIFSKYIGSRSTLYRYDDVRVIKESPPLTLQDLIPENNSTLQTVFNIAVDPATVDAPDFTVSNGIGSPASVTLIDERRVQLNFQDPIPGGNYTLEADNISDIDGNAIEPDASVEFALFDVFEEGDIVINEFMYDPPGNLPEYVELRNTTAKSFNLQDWQLADNNSVNTISSDTLLLEPDGFLVISPDTSQLNSVFGSRNYVQKSRFPALNNSGDDVKIFQPDSTIADSLTYTPEWGGSDVALERRSEEAISTAQANWGDSPAPEGGTPGRANQVEPDNTPPELTGLSFPDAATLQLTFSEGLTSGSAENAGNYALSGAPEVITASALAPDTVRLDIDPPMSNNTEFTLSLDNLEDIFGNTLSGADTTFTFFEITEADSGDILINEFMFDPPDGFTEYVELVNTSDKSIDLKDWRFNDAAGSPAVITGDSRVVPPGEWIVLAPDETLLETFPGISLIPMGSGFSALNNGGDQLIIQRADGARMDSLEYDNSWGGEGVALERRSREVSAIFRANWGDSPAPEGGTPGRANQVATDNNPPEIFNVRTEDTRTLSVVFNEEVKEAGDPDQYSLSPEIPVESVFVKADTVELQLADDLISGITYTLEVSGLQDLFGNKPSGPLNEQFTFFITGTPEPGQLIINEFMYRPPDGYSEYIELFNTSEEAFDLSELKINDNAGNPEPITQSQAIIPPGEWLVLAPDSTLPRLFPDRNFLVIGSSFPVLNNGGDAIKIIDNNDALLDSLLYLNSWGGDGVALERRSADAPSEFSENWGDSPSDDFGTPGIENEVAPDETPPEVLSVEALTDSRVEVTLSERPDAASATEPGTFSIMPSRSIQMVVVRSATVELILSQPLETDQTFTLEVSNLDDLFGNTLTEASEDFELFRFEQALPRDIVINEILYRKPANADLEFVELFNRSDKVIDLNLWQIKDSGGTPKPIDAPGAFSIIPIKPQEFIVLTNNEQFADTTANAIQVSGFPSLNDDSDDVVLNNTLGSVIDSLRYNSSWGGDERGISLERIDPFGASNDPSNWRSSEAPEGNTPAAENSVLTIDNIAPQPVFATQRPDGNIEVQFSEFINRNENLTFELGGSSLDIVEFDRSRANRIILESTTVDSSANPQITIRNLRDIRGNETPETTIPLSLPLEPGDVVINEIMFDPITGDTEDDPSQSEYIELFNRSNRAISLEGMIIFEERLSDGTFEDQLDLVNNTGIFVPSGETFLVYADPAEQFEDSRISRFFGLDSLTLFSRVDATSLQLVNSGQPLILSDSTGRTVDSLVYSEDWHNPNLVDTKGISLERKVPGAPSNDSENWGSASTRTVPEGGTPGQINTLFTQSTETEGENEITISPNPFSPNGDGKDDDLVIEYSLSETDFLLRVRIYDRFGRKVRTLADGEPAGRSGTLIWDGRDDQGRENRIGYYIIHFKAFNSSAGNNKTFQKTVVLARQL